VGKRFVPISTTELLEGCKENEYRSLEILENP
jgi:hypothetical protein